MELLEIISKKSKRSRIEFRGLVAILRANLKNSFMGVFKHLIVLKKRMARSDLSKYWITLSGWEQNQREF
jgi:hypothetical protein